ncbi:MAG TPA: PQQ-binding-like beta-propeller repeat protein, partial [Roseiflexaceae bacterium]|nr:PQQ-binding-like beta-propeller repeat protein [Roseiflexaceae bacterium]
MIGTLALLVTIAVIAIAALVVTDHPIVGSLTGALARATPLSATERAVALSAPGEAGLQTVAAVVRDGENAYRVALLDPATNKRMWTSEPVGDMAISYGQFAWNADTLVFVDERSVHSFKRSDGTLNWKTTLSDRVCPDCLALAGSSVVALTIDNQLAGIDLASGEVLWKQGDFRSIEQRLMPFDTAVAILADDDSGDRQAFVFDAETGTLRSNIALVCSQAADETAIEASSSDAAWYDDGMLTLYSSFSDTCIHSYDLRSGRQRWQQIIPREQALQSSMATSMRVLGSDLYIGGYGGLLATSLADGTTRMVAQNKEFAYEALALHDTSLVAGMTRIVGTQRRELWGLDT